MAEAFNHRHTSDQLLDAEATGRTVLRCSTLSTLWDYIGYKNNAGYVIIDGDTPGTISAGQAAIGGGQMRLVASGSLDSALARFDQEGLAAATYLLQRGSAATSILSGVAGDSEILAIGCNISFGTYTAHSAIIATGGAKRIEVSSGGITTISGSVPSYISSGQVAIGGGNILADGEIYAYGTDPNNTPLNGVILAGGAVRAYSDIASRTSVSCSNKVRMTPEGGIAIKITNKSGANSVKGRLVQLSGVSQDNAYTIAAADSFSPVGAEYESGIADGSDCWIVVSGIAEVLLKDSTASTRGYWAKVSDDTAGRADITNSVPPGGTIAALEDHGSEIGHALESKTAGTSVLCKIVMHFN